MAVNATAVWRVRPSGSNTNGGGYDPGISGAATDYSQQDAAQASGTHGSAVGTTTFTDLTAANFTAAMVGNAINIAGQGFYFVITVTDASHVVVDRALGTFTLASWSLGGGWADFANVNSGPMVDGNYALILGSGTPNPAAYVYDYTVSSAINGITASITIANDPGTPGYKAFPDTTGGMPVIKCNNAPTFWNIGNNNALVLEGLWLVATSMVGAGGAVVQTSFNDPPLSLLGCVCDLFGIDCYFVSNTNSNLVLIGTEISSSVVPGSPGTSAAVTAATAPNTTIIDSCNIHDTVGLGIFFHTGSGMRVVNSVIAKCLADGLNVDNLVSGVTTVKNCTIDGNAGNGVTINNAYNVSIYNNIISNQTGVGKFGISATSHLAPAFINFNVYYNNTADVNGISYGSHDTHGGSNPYVGQSTENYQLA